MSEYEIVDALGQHTNTMISLLQWWAGITLGILVGLHIIGKELNGFIASLLIGLYITFTAAISTITSAHAERQQLLIKDLAVIQDQGVALGHMAQSIIATSGPSDMVRIMAGIGFFGLFLSTLAYVIYSYIKAKKSV